MKNMHTPYAICVLVCLPVLLLPWLGNSREVSANDAAVASVSDAVLDTETAKTAEAQTDLPKTTSVIEHRTAQNQWIQNHLGWMYISNGAYLKDKWLVVDGNTYYLKEDGSCAHGLTQIRVTLYYFARSGELVRDTLVDDTYLVDQDGKVMTGYQWIENRQYFFQDDGQMLKGAVTPDGVYNTNQAGVIISINMTQSKSHCPLENAPGTSGYKIGGYPLELYMLSIAGETSGGSIINGDNGKAYGLCQFDYRYDLMDFINYAYGTHPHLWAGFKEIAGAYQAGDEALVSNETITSAFALADQLSDTNCATDQLTFLYSRYFKGTYQQLQSAGYNLAGRHIAVSAAMMSININCGVHTDLYLSSLSTEMTDEEMINALYDLRNGALTANGKGTNGRYGTSEPRLALDMLHGQVTVTSTLYYGSGVQWNKSLLRYCGGQISEAQVAARLASLGDGITGSKETEGTGEEASETSEAMEETTAQTEPAEIGPGIPKPTEESVQEQETVE